MSSNGNSSNKLVVPSACIYIILKKNAKSATNNT